MVKQNSQTTVSKPTTKRWEPDPNLVAQLRPDEKEKFQEFMRNATGYAHALKEYRDNTEFKHARVIPMNYGQQKPDELTPGKWITKQLEEWRRAERRGTEPTVLAKLKISVLKEPLKIPFAEYNHDFDINWKRLEQYRQTRAYFRQISGMTKALIVTVVRGFPRDDERFKKANEWITGHLRWWKKLSEEERLLPKNKFWIDALKEHTQIPFPEYSSLNDPFLHKAERYNKAMPAFRSISGNPAALIITKSKGERFLTDANWIEDVMTWWQGMTPEERKEPNARWRIGVVKKIIGIPFPEYNTHDDAFAGSIALVKDKQQEYRGEKHNEKTLLLPGVADPFYRPAYSALQYARRWRDALPGYIAAVTEPASPKPGLETKEARLANASKKWTEQEKWRVKLVDEILPLPFPSYSNKHDQLVIETSQYVAARARYWDENDANMRNRQIPVDAPGFEKYGQWAQKVASKFTTMSAQELKDPENQWCVQLIQKNTMLIVGATRPVGVVPSIANRDSSRFEKKHYYRPRLQPVL